MASCTPAEEAFRAIGEIDQAVALAEEEESTRIKVWEFNADKVQRMFYKGLTSITGDINSDHIRRKLKNFLTDLDWNHVNDPILKAFQNNILDSNTVIEQSIALHEIMESVKGEADKAVKNGIEISSVSVDVQIIFSF